MYNWSTSGEKTMGVGAIHQAGTSIDMTFDTEQYNFKLAKIKLRAYAREYDSTSANEDATANWEIDGENLFDDGGIHIFQLTDNNDFGFDVYIKVEAID